MNCKKLFSTAIVSYLSLCLSAQSQLTINTFLPKLTPTSPEATGLGRFGTYEVNLFTGLPDISIPIYNIEVGELKVPISISYHAAGVKVGDFASWAGLGWSLQTGGSITRKVMGNPDENPNAYLFSAAPNLGRVRLTTEINTNTDDGCDYLNHVYLKYYDTQPDIFSYSFPGHHGSFLFNQKNTNYAPVLIPFEPVKVYWPTAPAPYNLSLAMLDESGIDYKFEKTEFTSSGNGVTLDAVSTWMLTKMISSNKQDTIFFNFNQAPGYRATDSYYSDYVQVSDQITNNIAGQLYYTPDMGTPYHDLGHVNTIQQIISEIKFKNGKITFQASATARQDNSGLQNRLQYIKVYNYDAVSNSYFLIKTVELFHSYFSGNLRLRLDSIQVRGGSSLSQIQTYKFDYNTAIALPDHYSSSRDYWGYYNGRSNTIPNTSTPFTVPKMQISYLQGSTSTPIWIGGTNPLGRDPDPNYMQAGILQKITYPTGGFTQFEYETNQYQEGTDPAAYAGGLRIKSIKSYTSATATPLIKTYKYGANESGYGRKNFIPDHNFFATGQSYNYIVRPGQPGNENGAQSIIGATKSQSVYFANPTLDMEPYDGSPVVYPVVTEYIGDGTTNAGKTVYQFNDRPDAKTTAVFMNSPVFDSYHFIRGLLTNRSDYRRNTDGTYTIVKETRNTYQVNQFTSTTGGIGLAVFKRIIYHDNMGELEGLANTIPFNEKNSYQFANYEIVSSDNKLVSNTEIVYDQNDATKSISMTTTYAYDDPIHLGVTQVQTTNSKGEALKAVYTYPYNYPSTSPYPPMDVAHIWNKKVTDTKFNGTTQLTQQTSNFSSFGSPPYLNYVPANISVKVKANAVETRVYFNQFDARGNIFEMQKANDIKQSFIWDYGNSQLIAEVTGANKSDIAYTSFESDGTGGWSGITIPGFVTNGSVTGKRAYTQTGFSISKTGLSTTTTYTVSYWSKNGAYAVNGAAATSLRTINGWTLYQHTVANPSGGNITVSGTGTIDELRLYPSNAVMKTYAYEPLIGVSSICDANNHIVYYIYDVFSRLSLVKDETGNILKQNCYNYYNQSGSCSLFGNAVQSGVFTRTTCGADYNGGQSTYTVPANTYYAFTQADANTLATNDVNANGLAYANTYATCTPIMITITGTDLKSIQYTVTFTGVSPTPPNVYSFTIHPGDNNLTLGQIPKGHYNVQFQPGGSPPSATFAVGSNTIGPIPGGALFSNLYLTGNTLVRAF
jgi:uncharacterized protein DUF5977